MFRWDTRKRAIMNDKKFPSLFNLRVNKEPPVKCKWPGVWSTRQFHFPPFPWWKINFKKFLFKKETKRTHNTRAAELQNDNFGMTAFSL